jgi:hypothetical protein
MHDPQNWVSRWRANACYISRLLGYGFNHEEGIGKAGAEIYGMC